MKTLVPLGAQIAGASLAAAIFAGAAPAWSAALGIAVLSGFLSAGAYMGGSLLAGVSWSYSGMAIAFAGGALGSFGVSAVGIVGEGLMTGGQLAAFDVMWNSEIGLATSAAGIAFP